MLASVDADAPEESQPSEFFLFISDASAEAERLTLALRTQGYSVIDVPLALLVNRVIIQTPALVLCDADAEGAVSVLERLRDLPPENAVSVIVLGQRGGVMDQIDGSLVSAMFARPVNVKELLDTVDRLVGSDASPKSLPSSARGRFGSSSHPPSKAARSDAAAAVPLPPDLADAQPKENADVPALELSADILGALADAERRLDESRPAPGPALEEPGPEADLEGALPADVLAALEEPLDEEEAEQSQGTAGGTAAGGAGRTGTRGHTQTGANVGTDGTGTVGTDHGASGRGAKRTDRPSMPPSEGDEGRAARQQASTPKPPRPGTEVTGGRELRRPSMAPVTSVDSGTSAQGPPLAQAPLDQSLVPVHSVGPKTRRDEDLGAAMSRDLMSTTPPARNRDGRGDAEDRQDEPTGAPPRGAAAAGRPGSGKEADARADLVSRPVLRAGDAPSFVAQAIRLRFTGSLAFEVDEGIRRIVLRDGDFVTAGSGVHGESLVAFLAGRGDLPPEVAKQGHKLPAFGRRAGAALIAQGHVAQDQLWTILRAHAEWLIGRALRATRGSASVETAVIDRMQDEPGVFGGAAGAEVFVEVVRRVVPEDEALVRLGGKDARLELGPAGTLLAECALPQLESERVQSAAGRTVRDITEGVADPSFTSALGALVALGVLCNVDELPKVAPKPPPERDPLDDEAHRARILARKALVDEGDYFAVLGVPRDATGYDIRRAYSALRKDFDPGRALTATTADLADTVDEILEVLDEAYDVLGDQHRRERYRRAIEAVP